MSGHLVGPRGFVWAVYCYQKDRLLEGSVFFLCKGHSSTPEIKGPNWSPKSQVICCYMSLSEGK